jgi:hypothetical protein
VRKIVRKFVRDENINYPAARKFLRDLKRVNGERIKASEESENAEFTQTENDMKL